MSYHKLLKAAILIAIVLSTIFAVMFLVHYYEQSFGIREQRKLAAPAPEAAAPVAVPSNPYRQWNSAEEPKAAAPAAEAIAPHKHKEPNPFEQFQQKK